MPSASKLAGTKNTVSKSSLVDIQDAIALWRRPDTTADQWLCRLSRCLR